MAAQSVPDSLEHRFYQAVKFLSRLELPIGTFNDLILGERKDRADREHRTRLARSLVECLTPAGQKLLSVPPSQVDASFLDEFPRVVASRPGYKSKSPADNIPGVYLLFLRGPDGSLEFASKIGSASEFDFRYWHWLHGVIFRPHSEEKTAVLAREWNCVPEMIQLATMPKDEAYGLRELLEAVSVVEANTMHDSTKYKKHVAALKEYHSKDKDVHFHGHNRALPVFQAINRGKTSEDGKADRHGEHGPVSKKPKASPSTFANAANAGSATSTASADGRPSTTTQPATFADGQMAGYAEAFTEAFSTAFTAAFNAAVAG